MARVISTKFAEKLLKSYRNNPITPWLKGREETKELEVVFKRRGFAYSIEIPKLGRRIYDITNRIQAPKAYFGYVLLRLAKSYGLDGSGSLILKDEEVISLALKILRMRLNQKRKWKECVELVRKFEQISFIRKVGEVVPS